MKGGTNWFVDVEGGDGISTLTLTCCVLKDCIVMSECCADIAGINRIILIGDA